VHCTRDQEELWKQSGQLPACLPTAALVNNNNLDTNELIVISNGGTPPVCMDYMKGECKRAVKCKYRHLSTGDYENEQLADRQMSLQMAAVEAAMIFEETGALKKRKIVDGSGGGGFIGLDYFEAAAAAASEYHHHGPPTAVVSLADYQLLEEENRFLHHKVDDLKRHVGVLVATNELLLEQNARYRTTTTVMVPPIVAVSQVLTPTITPAGRHHAGPHGITTMATLGHVTINGHREIVMQPALVHHAQQSTGVSGTGVVDPSAAVTMGIIPMTIPLDGSAIGGPNMVSMARPSMMSMTVPNIGMNLAAAMSLPNMVMSGANMVPNMSIGGPNMASSGGGMNMASMSGTNMVPLSLSNMAFGGSNLGPPNMMISTMNMGLSGSHISSDSMPQLAPPPLTALNLPQTKINLMSYPIMSHTQLPTSSLI